MDWDAILSTKESMSAARHACAESEERCAPDVEGALEDDGWHVGGGCVAGQNGPQEQHCCDVVHIGRRLVCAHLHHAHTTLSPLLINGNGERRILVQQNQLLRAEALMLRAMPNKDSVLPSECTCIASYQTCRFMRCRELRGDACLPVEAHDDEGEHEFVHDAGAQKVDVHDVAPHAILHAWHITQFAITLLQKGTVLLRIACWRPQAMECCTFCHELRRPILFADKMHAGRQILPAGVPARALYQTEVLTGRAQRWANLVGNAHVLFPDRECWHGGVWKRGLTLRRVYTP